MQQISAHTGSGLDQRRALRGFVFLRPGASRARLGRPSLKPGCTLLIVGLAAVRNSRHIDCFGGIVDSVDDAEVADADSPQIPRALQLFAVGGPGIVGKLTNLCRMRTTALAERANNSRFADAAIVTL
jgi:hypothetical protein